MGAAHGPGVRAGLGIGHPVVGHVAVALVTEVGPPGVADDEDLLGVVVADGAHRVTAELGAGGGARHEPLGVRLEAVDLEAEDERIPFGEAVAHRVEVDGDGGRLVDLVPLALLVGLAVGLGLDRLDVEGPGLLGASAVVLEHLDAVGDVGADVLVGGVLHHALVVEDEEAADGDLLAGDAPLQVAVRAGQRVGRAALGLPLIDDGRAVGPEIDVGGEILRPVGVGLELGVGAMIGITTEIADGTLGGHGEHRPTGRRDGARGNAATRTSTSIPCCGLLRPVAALQPSRSSTATTCSGLRWQSWRSRAASKKATVVPGRATAVTLSAIWWMASRTP